MLEALQRWQRQGSRMEHLLELFGPRFGDGSQKVLTGCSCASCEFVLLFFFLFLNNSFYQEVEKELARVYVRMGSKDEASITITKVLR